MEKTSMIKKARRKTSQNMQVGINIKQGNESSKSVEVFDASHACET